jgi:group I intron endonuclease
MKIIDNKYDLKKPGIYKIRNIITKKFYIGSTTMPLIKRYWHHNNQLVKNCHKNQHLQNSWNKYSENNFVFEIIKNCDKQSVLTEEQYYINKYINKNILYNINPLASGTPNLSLETIHKRSDSIRLFIAEAKQYYKKLKSNSIDINSIPIKYHKYIKTVLGLKINIDDTLSFEKQPIWNKGKDKSMINYDFLKGVKKTITKKYLDARKNIGINRINKKPNIFVYNINYEFLGEFKNSRDLHLLSKEDNFVLKNALYIRKGGRKSNGTILTESNIDKAIKYNKVYKGLIIVTQPLHKVTYVEKLSKNGEV